MVLNLRGLYRFWQNFASRNWLTLERWHINCDTQNTQHILQKISAKARSTEWWVYFFFKLILVTTLKHFLKNFNKFCWHYQYSDFYFETGFHKIEYIVNDLPVSIFDNCSCEKNISVLLFTPNLKSEFLMLKCVFRTKRNFSWI